MADVGKAYLQIIPKAEGITGQLGQMIDGPAKSAGEKGGKSAGGGMVSGIKKALAGLAIGGTIVAGFKAAISEGAKLQQSFGGIDTLYGDVADAAAKAGMTVKEYTQAHGDAAETMKRYAQEAAKVGISANDYAEQAVSFGASLKQAFGGDAAKAAEAANTAILDMTDNAAKMGTPLESIQNAYQGFAKGNYTMLDNLKLGYGGTKEEMQRLLTDATKLTGVKYDMNNLGDVYEAIHVIQGDLGLTGVAAEEASHTFSGSFEAMKASAANLFAALSTGGDVQGAMSTLLSSAGTFFFDNFLPMMGQIVSALPGAISTAISTVAPILAEKIPELISKVSGMISTAVPMLTEKIPQIMTTIGTLITTYAPGLVSKGLELVQNLALGILNALPEIQAKAGEMLNSFYQIITDNLPTILDKGKTILTNIASGILAAIPKLISTGGEMVTRFINFLTANLPTIGAKGGEFLQSMATKIVASIPSIIAAVAKMIPKIVTALAKLVPVALKAALNMIKSLVKGIKNGFSQISPAIKTLVEKIKKPIDELKDKLRVVMENVMNAMSKVWDDIKGKAQTAWEAVKTAITTPIDNAKKLVDSAVSKIKGLFPISMGKIFKGVQLPHFKISGGTPPWGIGGQGTKPSVKIEWYKRGGIATDPTVYGIGEAGNEAIVPLSNPYMRPFAKAIAQEMPASGNTYNINISGAGNPQAVVDELLRRVELKARTA